MTKNTPSNRSAFSQSQFNADTYHNSICITAESALALNRATYSVSNVLCNDVMEPICGR